MNRKRSEIMERRGKLLELIRHVQKGQFNVEQVSEYLGISPVTLRRDLTLLEQEGLIRRAYGKVILAEADPGGEEQITDIPNRIARAAAAFVEAGDVIFVNASRTAQLILCYVEAPNVTVITNSIMAANMPHRSDLTLVLTGGELRYPMNTMTGSIAQQSLSSIKANKAFLGCSGLSVERGMTTEHYGEVAINHFMLTNITGSTYLLASHSKLGRDASFTSGEIQLIRELITDSGASQEQLRALEAAGVHIHLA